MNTITYIQQGQLGRNKGLPLRDPYLDMELGGLKRATYYMIGAEQKVGKTAFINEQFILGPLLHDLSYPVYYYYWATEMTRIKTELGVIAYLAYDIFNMTLDVELLSGHRKDRHGNVVKLTVEQRNVVRYIYNHYIIPIFGEYDHRNKPIPGRSGKITYFSYKENPTGIRNYLINRLSTMGTIEYMTLGKTKVIEGYIPHDPRAMHVGVIDHIRGLASERGYNKKQGIDKMSEYMVELRNTLGISWVATSHLNRANNDITRLKLLGQYMYPSTESFKDSGNAAEDGNVIITLFNPTDEKYGLTQKGVHMKYNMVPHMRYGDYRTVHITENRDGPSPVHFGYRFRGAVKRFEYITQLPV